jgi:hypothetical protein
MENYMFKKIQSILYSYRLLIVIISIYSPNTYAQFEGLSIHTDFLSINIPSGFDNNYIHPGNFLAGLQYNLSISTDFEINAGVDFFYAEATGVINSEPRQVEVFIPSVFVGIVLDFDSWAIFGKIGYSPAGSINKHGKKEWVSTLAGFDMYPIQIGAKYNIFKDLDLTASLGNYFGNSVKIDNNIISLTTLNLGLSYNLFDPHPETLNVVQSNDNYKYMYNKLLNEKEKLEKQNIQLIKQMNIIDQLNKSGKGATLTVDSVLSIPQIKSISVDSINLVYNLHIGHPLNIKSFVNKYGMSDDGKLILGEYNSIATLFRGFPSGIWFICYVPDTSVFLSNKNDFPRIEFRNDPGIKKTLVINFDVEKTETNNLIKVEIK